MEKTDRDPNKIIALQVRMKETLRSQIEGHAQASGNSMNAEIIERLSASFEFRERFAGRAALNLFVEMASQIRRAESMTGKPCFEDPETYFAARHLVDDVWNRSRPKPTNFDEITDLQVKLGPLMESRRALENFLEDCGVLGPGNALLSGGVRDDGRLYLMNQSNWRNPTAPDEPLSAEDREILKVKVQERQKLADETAALEAKIAKLLKPWSDAKARGEVIYRQLCNQMER